MNIEQYRALKEQQANQPQATEQAVVAETIEEQPEVALPTKVLVGEEEVELEELKSGYLRQSDYTKKTQEVSRQKKEAEEAIAFYEHLKQNPQIVNQLQQTTNVPDRLDPTQAKVIELEAKMYDMMLEKEISDLQSKYSDFEVMDVLEVASTRGLSNLEDAYYIVKSSKGGDITTDVNALKEQIRKELLTEINNEAEGTKTIISTQSAATPTETVLPSITPQEVKVARMMGMSEGDYIAWRDVSNKK